MGQSSEFLRSKMDSYRCDLNKECHDGLTCFPRWFWLLSRPHKGGVGQEYKAKRRSRSLIKVGLYIGDVTGPINFFLFFFSINF